LHLKPKKYQKRIFTYCLRFLN